MRRLAEGRGSVLMEYVVVNMAVAVPLLMLWHGQVFDLAKGRWTGEFGLGIQAMFQRVLSGIALPIP